MRKFAVFFGLMLVSMGAHAIDESMCFANARVGAAFGNTENKLNPQTETETFRNNTRFSRTLGADDDYDECIEFLTECERRKGRAEVISNTELPSRNAVSVKCVFSEFAGVTPNYFSNNLQQVKAAYAANPGDINKIVGVWSPLKHALVGGDSPDIVKFLVDKGADVNAFDSGQNPMILSAIIHENAEDVRTLITAGANLDVNDSYGTSVLEYTQTTPEILKMIQDALGVQTTSSAAQAATGSAARSATDTVAASTAQAKTATNTVASDATARATTAGGTPGACELKQYTYVSTSKSNYDEWLFPDSGYDEFADERNSKGKGYECNRNGGTDACAEDTVIYMEPGHNFQNNTHGERIYVCQYDQNTADPTRKNDKWVGYDIKDADCSSTDLSPATGIKNADDETFYLDDDGQYCRNLKEQCSENLTNNIKATKQMAAEQNLEDVVAAADKILIVCQDPKQQGFREGLDEYLTLVAKYGLRVSQDVEIEISTVVDATNINSIVGELDTLRGRLPRVTVWRTAQGQFNTSRLVSDSVAGVVLGTAGGLITSNIIKKNQIENGFEDLSCAVGGQVVAAWDDEFIVGIK